MTFQYEFTEDDISRIADKIAQRIISKSTPATQSKEYAGESEILNSRQAQAYLKVSASTLARRRKSGSFPFIQHGSVITYRKSDLDDWLGSERNHS